jgi:hypothetical protein
MLRIALMTVALLGVLTIGISSLSAEPRLSQRPMAGDSFVTSAKMTKKKKKKKGMRQRNLRSPIKERMCTWECDDNGCGWVC